MVSLNAKANENFFNLIIVRYPHLNTLKLKNNILEFHDYKINLENFRLIALNQIPEIFTLTPFDVFNLIKIHLDVEAEKKYINENEYNENTLYLQIRAILVKDVIDGNEIEMLNQFSNAYLTLLQYQEFLLDDAKNKFDNMQNVIRENLFNDYIKITPGISELMKNLNITTNDMQEKQADSKGQSLTLTNPKFPSILKDENEQQTYKTGTYGYANILLLLYVVLNIGFILAIMLIK